MPERAVQGGADAAADIAQVDPRDVAIKAARRYWKRRTLSYRTETIPDEMVDAIFEALRKADVRFAVPVDETKVDPW